ncbi:hypothetical protein [Thermococcus barossii]|uniref:Uncharacterized protein n=1 Tax=Thermococcus barossii TaxID=54077 RepID=A0A2Z2MJ94_9EURY|nr:hypothetical protein [Thermococcus barossii]ASJ05609.1 hypothetical protein A3L01_09630 [Thermococcus barossii]
MGTVNIPKPKATLDLTNMREDLTITITLNRQFANYYLDYPPLDYSYKLTGYSYMVIVDFAEIPQVSDVVYLTGSAGLDNLETKVRVAYNTITTIKNTFEDIKSGIVGVLETSTAKGIKELAWILKYHRLLEDRDVPEYDENNIIGG